MFTPVAHIQAGERSGNIDGVARHAFIKTCAFAFSLQTQMQHKD